MTSSHSRSRVRVSRARGSRADIGTYINEKRVRAHVCEKEALYRGPSLFGGSDKARASFDEGASDVGERTDERKKKREKINDALRTSHVYNYVRMCASRRGGEKQRRSHRPTRICFFGSGIFTRGSLNVYFASFIRGENSCKEIIDNKVGDKY